MTFRSRPVLDRKHRPRWQDELRTQQLTILGFALAIALALGIFGAAAWNGYWETHFRPVATVAGSHFDRSDLAEREAILTAEAVATVTELQAQLGGPRDQVLQQQIDSVSQRFNDTSASAAESLVLNAVLAARADEFGVSVGDEEVNAAVAERISLPERVRAQLILVEALPDDADPDDEPTEEQLEEARSAAQEARDRVEDGEEFAEVAADLSDDFTATAGGDLGWFEADDAAYDAYFDALQDAASGDLVGPIETDRGYAVLQLLERRDAAAEGELPELLDQQGVSDQAYREFVRGEVMLEAYRAHFTDEVVGSQAPQRRVARIGISPLSEEPVPQERARHVLIQPLPDAEDQGEATDDEWEAAREEAEEVRAELSGPDADWYAIAEERSDDPGSGASGGDLGWYDPEASPFVAEFDEALAQLEIGEVSEPVRTDFGWHVIQKIGERESPEAQAAELVETLREDPDAFAETARRLSDDQGTAADGGEVGWIAPYQLDPMHERTVFDLDQPDEISEPVEDEDGTITIYRLLESSESRDLDEAQLGAISRTGFDRWLADEVQAPVETWMDPQFESAAGS